MEENLLKDNFLTVKEIDLIMNRMFLTFQPRSFETKLIPVPSELSGLPDGSMPFVVPTPVKLPLKHISNQANEVSRLKADISKSYVVGDQIFFKFFPGNNRIVALFDGWGEKDSDISLVVYSGGEQKVIKFYENSLELSKSRTPLYGPYHVSSQDGNLFILIDVPNLKAGMSENSWIVQEVLLIMNKNEITKIVNELNFTPISIPSTVFVDDMERFFENIQVKVQFFSMFGRLHTHSQLFGDPFILSNFSMTGRHLNKKEYPPFNVHAIFKEKENKEINTNWKNTTGSFESNQSILHIPDEEGFLELSLITPDQQIILSCMQRFKRGDLQKKEKETFFSIEAEFVFAKISDNTIIDVGSRSMLCITLKLDFKIDENEEVFVVDKNMLLPLFIFSPWIKDECFTSSIKDWNGSILLDKDSKNPVSKEFDINFESYYVKK